MLSPARAQSKQGATATSAGGQALVERGKYIVENVAMCELCHTPRDEHGNPDRSRWLKGGAVPLRPASSVPDWPLVEPRIAGDPPGTDAEFIRLLTTGISRTHRQSAEKSHAAFSDDTGKTPKPCWPTLNRSAKPRWALRRRVQ